MNPFLSDLFEQRELIVDGIYNTLLLFVAISFSGFVFGIGVFFFRVRKATAKLAQAFISFFIGTPLILLLFLIYYGIPQWGLSWSPFAVSLIGFTLNVGAYNAYYLYASYQSIPGEEIEAAYSQGFSPSQTFRVIILPQVLRSSIAPLINQVIRNLKDTSLVFLIQYVEFFARMQELAAGNFRFFEAYFFTSAVYLALVSVVILLGRAVERKFRLPQEPIFY